MTENTTIIMVPIDKIVPDPNQPIDLYEKGSEAYKEHLEKLTESIKVDGLYEPIHIRIHPTKEEMYMIVNGETIWTAKRNLSHKEIACVVKTFKNEDEVWLAQTRSNAQRKGFNSLTDLRNYKSSLDKKNGDESLFKAMCRQNGFKPTTIKKKLKLLSLPEDVLILWEQKELPEATCHYILTIGLTSKQSLEILGTIRDKPFKKAKGIINAFIAKEKQESLFYQGAKATEKQKPKNEEKQKSKKDRQYLHLCLGKSESFFKKVDELSRIAEQGKYIPYAFGKQRSGKVKKKGNRNNPDVGYDKLLAHIKETRKLLDTLEQQTLDLKVAATPQIKKPKTKY